MEKNVFLLIFTLHFASFHFSTQMLPPSESQALLNIQHLLNFNNSISDFCNLEPTESLTLVCYEDNLAQLHINGENRVFPQAFSTDSLFSTLGTFSNLKVLSLVSLGMSGELPGTISQLSALEILNLSSNSFFGSIPSELSSLNNLQSLVLDHNGFNGQVPVFFGSLQFLAVLSVKNNSLTGPLPESVSKLQNLRILAVSGNNLSGEVPDLRNLTNLQVLDLENNEFGQRFPNLHRKISTLVLRNNKFRSGVPEALGSFYQLQKLDVSVNGFVGPFPLSVLALPAMNYLDISKNKFTGRLLTNMSCNPELRFVNLSTNLLTGDLPSCLKSGSKVLLYSSNCLSGEEQEQEQEQHPSSFCHNEALAVKILPDKPKNKKTAAKVILATSIIGGTAATAAIVCLALWMIQKQGNGGLKKSPSTRLIIENVQTINTAKLLSDARYISETMKMGANLPSYRTFSLEELKNATNNFSDANLMDEYQIHRGKLKDGVCVAIRCLKMKKRSSIQAYTHHIELISKLRHANLASALGHCFECCLDDSSIGTAYVVFEDVSDTTLRNCISGDLIEHKLSWTQRVAAAVGVTKGIQFLHTGIVPGVMSNNLKITDVVVDQNLHVKIRSYNLPLITENWGTVGAGVSSQRSKANTQPRENHKGKSDVYDIGVILLEMIVGKPIQSENDAAVVTELLQVCVTMDDTARRSIVDPKIMEECSAESLKIAMEICLRCLSIEPAERPSVEDVLWNLQFAAQLQDSPGGDSQNSM